MSVFAEGLFNLVEKQREVFFRIVALKSPTTEELNAVRQLARSALDRDLGMLVSPVSTHPLSGKAVGEGWSGLGQESVSAFEAFEMGVRFAERKHNVGEASQAVHLLPPALLKPVRPLLKTPNGSVDPALVSSTFVYKSSTDDGVWYCVVKMASPDGRDSTSQGHQFATEDGARALDDAIQAARNALVAERDWLPFLPKMTAAVGSV